MPAMKVSGDSEAEGEPEGGDAESVSGGDTERSGGSSRPDRDSSAEEADEPDSDDSSEMDETECERRRNACLENIANMERQFILLREQLYRERISQVDYQLTEVRGGRSQEYLGPLQQLQENMRTRIEVAGVLRQLRIENIKHHCEAEELAALQNLNFASRRATSTRLGGAYRAHAVFLKYKMASEIECNLFMKSLKMSAVIEAVEKHPAIWNTFTSEYKERKKLEQSWSSICKEFIPGWEDMPKLLRSKYLSEMKKKWANVRDYYRRDLLQKIDNKKTRYVYFDLLSFLKPIYLEEKMNDDGEVSDEELAAYEDEYLGEIAEEQSVVSVKTEAEDPIQTPSTSDLTVDYVPSKTRPKESKCSPFPKRHRVEDDDLTFFRCLLPDIKRLTDQQKFDFKLGTMKLLKKIQSDNAADDTSSD